jgi:hypothetical protein
MLLFVNSFIFVLLVTMDESERVIYEKELNEYAFDLSYTSTKKENRRGTSKTMMLVINTLNR